jgi:predicted HTH domain antitoxin
MSGQIAISYPETLADSMKMQSNEFAMEIKMLSLVKLYEMGKVSSGMAANVLGISRIAFLDILDLYHVSYFADASELESDFRNASRVADACVQEKTVAGCF